MPESVPAGRDPQKLFRHFDRRAAENGLEELDVAIWDQLISTELSPEEIEKAGTPSIVSPGQTEVMALHFHPEWVPLNLIELRLARAFPHRENVLAIPTQHNRLLRLGPWAGVEVDCYAPEYRRKIQLLLHGPAGRLLQSSRLLAILDKTFNYRATQLSEIIHSLVEDCFEPRRQKAAAQTGATAAEVNLARFYAARLFKLMSERPPSLEGQDQRLKNRLLTDYVAAQEARHSRPLAQAAVLFIKAVKKEVKRAFNCNHFHLAAEVIEEARGLGCGLIIPHPQLFWPVLLAGLDVDGWEIWNPSTPDFSPFLLEALHAQNQRRPRAKKLLPFMGDDTHLSAKIKSLYCQDEGQENREIGWQPPWEAPEVSARMKSLGYSRAASINEYRHRLNG